MRRPGNFAGFTQFELQEDSKTLFYEFEALCQNAASLTALDAKPVKTDIQRWQMNALIESFGIHCRALVSFFFDDDPRSTDVVASDFKMTNWSPVKTAGLSVAYNKANKQIAHITTDRRGLNQSPQKESVWDFRSNLADVCDLMSRFLQSVPSEYIAPGMNPALQHLIRSAHGLMAQSVAPAQPGNAFDMVPVPPQTKTHSPSLSAEILIGMHAKTAPTPIGPSTLKTD